MIRTTRSGSRFDVAPGSPKPVTHVGHPEPNKLALATMHALAKQALVQLGFKATEARAAIDRAGPRDSVEALVREALRQVR
jgi:Holliday junction resolvasome RuvABC DNA-binding subunit